MATQMLLATDWSRSALQSLVSDQRKTTCYTPYGWRPGRDDNAKTGFTGQICEPELKWYLLGNGHRGYNPALMRFSSPDHLSPFGKGGVNAYMYCHGDPVNYFDPDGTIDYPFWGAMLSAMGAGRVVDHVATLYHMAGLTYDRQQAVKLGVEGLPDPVSRRDLGATVVALVLDVVGIGFASKNMSKSANNDADQVLANFNVYRGPSEEVVDQEGATVASAVMRFASSTEALGTAVAGVDFLVSEMTGGLRSDYAKRHNDTKGLIKLHHMGVSVPPVQARLVRRGDEV